MSKRRQKGHEDTDDLEWTRKSDCNDYNSASSSKKIKAESSYIPRQTSYWTTDELHKLHIATEWTDKNTIKDIDNFFDIFPHIKQILDTDTDTDSCMPRMDEDLIKIMNYLNSQMTFNTSVPSIWELRTIKETKEFLQREILPENMLDSDLLKDVAASLQNKSKSLLYHVEVGRIAFQTELFELLFDLLDLDCTGGNIEEMRFTSMLEKFCRMCNLIGSFGIVEESKIKDVSVVAIPDLTFKVSGAKPVMQIMSLAEAGSGLSDENWPTLHEVTEVKLPTDDFLVEETHHATRKNPEPFENRTSQVMDPLKIRGFSQHVGQLIIGHEKSFFQRECLGLLLHKTKILMTCLSTPIGYGQIKKRNTVPKKKATVHCVGPYDILRAEDRKQLIKAFLCLGNRQALENKKRYTKN